MAVGVPPFLLFVWKHEWGKTGMEKEKEDGRDNGDEQKKKKRTELRDVPRCRQLLRCTIWRGNWGISRGKRARVRVFAFLYFVRSLARLCLCICIPVLRARTCLCLNLFLCEPSVRTYLRVLRRIIRRHRRHGQRKAFQTFPSRI